MLALNIGINHWIQKEFQTINFRSKHLEKRFLKVMNNLSEEPEKTIWPSSRNRTNTKATYRMLRNEKFTKKTV